MRSISVFGRGSGGSSRSDDRPRKPDGPRILVKRQWRLGDIVMCEPACRSLSERGAVTFSTRGEYHPVVQFFSGTPPRTMSYPPPDRPNLVLADEIIDLDVVTLDHPGFETKVDAFISECGIDPTTMPRESKVPIVEPSQRYQAWARVKLEEYDILGKSLIAVVRQSYDAASPRSLVPSVVDRLVGMLSRTHHVIYVGATPVRLEVSDSIHNLTGCTPDVTFVAGLLKQCRLLVTVDTGLMHLAGAMGVPMVSVMGPTRPEDLAMIYDRNSVLDVGPSCSPCYDRGCEDPCLHRVDVNEIYHLCLSRLDAPDVPSTVHRP